MTRPAGPRSSYSIGSSVARTISSRSSGVTSSTSQLFGIRLTAAGRM